MYQQIMNIAVQEV